MNMQVVDFLPAFNPCVGDDAKATVWIRVTPLLQSQPGRQRHHAPQQAGVLGADVGHIVGFTEGAEASAPFPQAVPLDAYVACLVEQIHYSPPAA